MTDEHTLTYSQAGYDRGMQIDPGGNWVRRRDHEALHASREELLEALETLTYYWRELLNNVNDGPEYEAYLDARAAIAKSRGQKDG